MIVFLIVGVAFMVLGLFLLLDAYLFRRSAQRVRGHVVAYEAGHFNAINTITYTPVIVYAVDGQGYRFLSDIGATTVPYEIGEEVPVLIMDTLHSTARIERSARVGVSLALLLMGSVALYFFYEKLGDVTTYSWLTYTLVALVGFLTFGLLGFAKIYRRKKEQDFSYALHNDGLIGYEMTENVETSPVVLEKTKPTKTTYKVSLLLSFILFAFSLYWANRVHLNIENSIQTDGVIVKKVSSFSDGVLVYTPVIEYKVKSGEVKRFTSKLHDSNPSWQVGEQVSVYYKKDDTSHVFWDKGVFNYIVQIVLGTMGFIVLFISALNLLGSRSKH